MFNYFKYALDKSSNKKRTFLANLVDKKLLWLWK